jgi:MFS transporter, DHA1 family, inner membrane transport protein
MTWKERLILVLLAALNFTHILDFMIMMPLGNYLMPYFNITPQEFTVLVSVYTISAAVSGFFAAFFVDNFDRKKILLLAYCGFLLGTICCGIAPTYALLLIARTVAGIFGGLIGAQVLSIIADTFSYERRGAAMGAIMSAFALASTFGIPFALYLANHFSWHAPFLFLGILGIILVPLIFLYLPPMTSHLYKDAVKQDKIKVLTDVLKNKKQYTALIFSGLIMFGHFLIIPFINPYMELNVGFSKNITPLIYLVGGTASFFASNILGQLSDKYGKLSIFTICVFAALPMIFAITNLPPMQAYVPVLALFGFWFVAATGRGVTASAMVSNVVNPEHRGSFQSFNSSMQQLGTGLASLLTGFIVTKNAVTSQLENYDKVGYLSIITLLICVWLGNITFKKLD